MRNSDNPAMPIQFEYQDSKNSTQIELWRGLTKREHFAAMAMQGLCANACVINMGASGFTVIGNLEILAIERADKMLSLLEKEVQNDQP